MIGLSIPFSGLPGEKGSEPNTMVVDEAIFGPEYPIDSADGSQDIGSSYKSQVGLEILT
jgi:hypothetical protein